MATSNKLARLMQTLPQELFDKISDHVFTAEGEEHVVDWDYKPPLQLQADRASREKFAEPYRGNGTIFSFPSGLDLAWATSLPKRHFNKIRYLESWCRFRKPIHTDFGEIIFVDFKKTQNLDFLSIMKRQRISVMAWEWISDRSESYQFVDKHWRPIRLETSEDLAAREGWVRMTWTKLHGK